MFSLLDINLLCYFDVRLDLCILVVFGSPLCLLLGFSLFDYHAVLSVFIIPVFSSVVFLYF